MKGGDRGNKDGEVGEKEIWKEKQKGNRRWRERVVTDGGIERGKEKRKEVRESEMRRSILAH